MIRTIAAKELKSLFVSPVAWVTLAVLQFLFAFLFFSRIELFLQYQPRLRSMDNAPGITEIVVHGLFSNAGLILLIIVPLFCARSLAEEIRSGTLKLVLSSPISLPEIVLGKFLGLLVFFVFIIGLLAMMSFSLLLAGPADIAQIIGSLFALFLLIMSAIAIGLFISSLTSQPSVATISTITFLFFLWIIKWDSENGTTFVTYLSLQEHFESMIGGFLASVDVIYFLILIVLFLALTIWRLDWVRY